MARRCNKDSLDPKAKPDKKQKNVNKAAEKLLKNIPPPPNKSPARLDASGHPAMHDELKSPEIELSSEC